MKYPSIHLFDSYLGFLNGTRLLYSFLRLIVFFGFAINASDLKSQNQSNNWYFGEKAGLFFENQNPTQVLTNGKMVASEACVAISDKDGNLLFYTNGTNVWNSNHSIMINGALVGTLGTGGPITTTPNILLNTIIVPINAIEGTYYIFTISNVNGLRYSVVDMSGDSGLGEVTLKNRGLLPGEGIGKLSAVHHSDGKTIWLLTTRKNENDEFTSFYAYKIEENGDIDAPVITDNLFYKGLQFGQMKFSPNAEKIACANYRPDELSDHLMVFDFDSQSGVVSNKMNLLTSFTFFEVVSAYGVEFSNDSKYLYATLTRQGMISEDNGSFQEADVKNNLLYQYDFSILNPQEYAVSLHEEVNELTAAHLQLAKNGKIYRAMANSGSVGTSFLGVINTPTEYGIDANYLHNSVDLLSGNSRLGLPSFIQSYFRTRILAEDACSGESIPMEVDTYAKITEAEWDFGDGNNSNEITPEHTYVTPGNYEVKGTVTINNCPITVTKDIRIYDLPNLDENQELLQCDTDTDTDTDGISIFNLNSIREKITNPLLNEELFFYENEQDAILDENRIVTPENYNNTIPNQEIFIRAVNNNGCIDIESFIIAASFTDIGVITEMYACDDDDPDADSSDSTGVFSIGFKKNEIMDELNLNDTATLSYFPSMEEALTLQNEIRQRFFTSETTTIWVRVQEDNQACSGIAPLDLIVNSETKINIEDEYLICRDEPIILYSDSANDRFEWINTDNGTIISSENEVILVEPGNYQHIAYKFENGIECSRVHNFVLTKNEQPSFSEIEVFKVSKNRHTIDVTVTGSSQYEFSLDNIYYYNGLDSSYNFENVPAGEHTIYVRDKDECEPTIQKTINIIGYPSFFTPNNDGVNDFWRILGITSEELDTIRIKIYNRFGKLVAYLDEKNNYSWDGTYKGEIAPQDDYWYETIFTNGKTNRGHFTLRR